MSKIPNLLLDPSPEAGGGLQQSAGVTIVPAANIQQQATTGSPSVPVSQESVIPDSVKGTTFDIEGEDMSFGEASKDFKETKVEFAKKDAAKIELIKKEEGFKAKFPEKENEPATKEQLESLVKDKSTQKLPARDFSVFPEEVKEILKDTSRAAFDFITKTFKESQELKASKEKLETEYKKVQEGGVPSSWYEHPESWRLHPHAQNSLGRLEKLDAEEGFWREQLENINNGQKFRLLRGWNNQTGELVAGDEIEPSEQAKTDIFLRLGRYQSEKNSEAVRLNTFAQSFGSQMKKFNSDAEAIIEKEWPWHKDEKHEAQKWVKEFMGLIPEPMREQMGFRVASLLYATFSKTNELLAEERTKNKTGEIVKESTRLAEPSLRSPSVGGKMGATGTNGVYTPPPTFNLEGM